MHDAPYDKAIRFADNSYCIAHTLVKCIFDLRPLMSIFVCGVHSYLERRRGVSVTVRSLSERAWSPDHLMCSLRSLLFSEKLNDQKYFSARPCGKQEQHA